MEVQLQLIDDIAYVKGHLITPKTLKYLSLYKTLDVNLLLISRCILNDTTIFQGSKLICWWFPNHC